MSNPHAKISLSATRQSEKRVRRGQRNTVPFGAHTGVLSLLSLAACASGGDDLTSATATTPTTGTVLLPVSDIPLDDAFLYIAPEGALDGADLKQIDLSSLVLDGGGDTTLINLGDLDASEVSIVTNSEGNQVFAVSRAAVINRASAETSSAPVSYSLAASRDINFVDRSGDLQTIKAHAVIAEAALRTDPGFIAVIKKLADVEGTSAQLAATTVDLNEVFLSTSEISFSAVDDDGNTYALSDKNGDGVSAEFSLDELAASFGESGTITVYALIAGNISAEQTFSVVVTQTAVNTPFVGDGSVVTITDGSTSSASVVVLPLSGGDGEITYALEGENKDSGGFFILQGRLFFSADATGEYTLVATDADGDEASITIDFTIPGDAVSIANPLTAQTHVGNVGNVTVSLAEVFVGGDGDLTLSSNDGNVASNTLVINTAALEDGDHTITVTAADSDGDIAIDTFVLTVDKSPTVDTAINNTALAGGNDGTTIDVSGVFGHPADGEELTLSASVGTIGTDGMLTLSGADIADGTNTITLTATDSDLASSESVTSTFVITTDKAPTVDNVIADIAVVGNGTHPDLIDLNGVFKNGSGNLTLSVAAAQGVINGNELDISGVALADGANIIVVTATDDNGDEVTTNITINADKSPTVVAAISDDIRATNHSNTTIDLTTVFDGGSGSLTYAVTASNGGAGVSTANSTLTIDYAALGAGTHTVTVTATDSDAHNADAVTDEFVIRVIKLNDHSLGSNAALSGTTYADAITDNSFAVENYNLHNVDLDGGVGDDTISRNTFTGIWDVKSITLDGGVGDDTISSNTLTASDVISQMMGYEARGIFSITFDGGAGNDTISSNILSASRLSNIIFDGGDGNDTIGNNTFAWGNLVSITFSGGDGDDTISNNTFNAGGHDLHSITLDGGAGNDTISDNHFETTGAGSSDDVYLVTLKGGAGNDLFRDNTATQANGESASLSIDGGDGEDTVVFRLNADQYTGAAAWLHGETITISGDGAAVTLIDIETLSFADGTAYTVADAIIEGNGGTTIDLASVFAEQVTSYIVSVGTVGSNNRLTLDGSDLNDGVSTLTVTATDRDGNEVTTEITINADKSPTIAAAISDDIRTTNHSNTTIDLTTVFDGGGGNLTYAVTASNGGTGVRAANSALTIDYAALGVGTHTVTVTATDSNADAITDEFVLQVFNYDSRLNDNSLASNTTLTGTTLDDAITGNSFAVKNYNLSNVDLDGGAGDDAISNNIFTAGTANDVYYVDLIGGAGNDTISNNTLTANRDVDLITFAGGDGDDTISSNALTANRDVDLINFDGGNGDDTIRGNTLISNHDVVFITFDGGAGNDTISDNHFESKGTLYYHDVYGVNLMGGAGDDVFRNNTATQGNGQSAMLTIDGGDGKDTVVFRLNAGEYAGLSEWSDFAEGGGTTITLTGDGAVVTLIDVETISFADGASYSAADAGVEHNDGVLYDLANAFLGAFPDAETTIIAYKTDRGTITGNTLALAGTELEHGANTITVTATVDGTETTETITVNAVKTLKIAGLMQHDEQTIDLNAIFVDANTYAYTSNTPAGINLSGSTLTFDNNNPALTEGEHTITITASDASDVFTHTLTYSLDAIKDQIFRDGGSNSSYTGTTLADAITGNSFAVTNNNLSNVDWDGGNGDDTISNNTLAGVDVFPITFAGGDGNDTISNNTLTASDYVDNTTFDGGNGNDTISNNTFAGGEAVYYITLAGGNGNDTISGNKLMSVFGDFDYVWRVTFDGGDGNDTINSNTLTASDEVVSITFAGGDGNDTISNNNLAAIDVNFITFDGGDGNDTISDNHIESKGMGLRDNIASVALMGGAGDDVFRNNTATQANGESALLIIDGGDGEDTVVFRSIAGKYAGLADWINSSDGGVTTITLTGDGAAVTLIDVETVSFADGATYSAADAWVEGNEELVYNLANAFSGDTTYTAYDTDRGTIGTGNTLTLARSELAHGANTIVITATATDNAETIKTITVNAVKDLEIVIGATQHNQQTFDLGDVFVETTTTSYTALTLADGVTLGGGNLIFDNTVLSIGVQPLTITATDGSDAVTHTLIYTLDTIKDQTFSEGGSNSSYTGTTLADAITGNSFAVTNNNLTNVNLESGAGNDTINSNTFTAIVNLSSVYSITFDGGDGDDTMRNNTLTASDWISSIIFDGGDGNDTITNNTLNAGAINSITFAGGNGNDSISNNSIESFSHLASITFSGGDDNDTISNNTFTAGEKLRSVTFDGGDGNDTISDNHIESTGTSFVDNIVSVTLMGGAGDDLFRDNTATQANGGYASLIIDGGDGEDTVMFRSVAGEYAGLADWIDSSDGGMTTITITGDGAAVTLVDVETIYFADGASFSAADAGVEGNGGTLYDLANAFSRDTTYTAYDTDRGTIGTDNTLTLAGTELGHGANTIVLTATASDSSETTKTITINVAKTLRITGAQQHDEQTIDLNAIFVDPNTYTYSSNTPVGINLNGSTLTFDNTNSALTEGEHTITITATDASNVVVGAPALTYDLGAIKDQVFDGSPTYTGTTLADAITGNSLSASTLTNVDLDGGDGNDTIGSNTLTAGENVISVTFDGGDGNDTISNNTLTAGHSVNNITFDGGDGNDTLSDNHIESTGTQFYNSVYDVTLMGGAGDDVFRDNTATQANGELSSITIDGGAGTDKVYFDLAQGLFTIKFDGGGYGSNITVTDKAARTETADGVDSYAEYVLIDVEELYFNNAAYDPTA